MRNIANKYYYTLNDAGLIATICENGIKEENGIEITQDEYQKYLDIISSVPDKEGYMKAVALKPDFSYEVSYTEIPVIEEGTEPAAEEEIDE